MIKLSAYGASAEECQLILNQIVASFDAYIKSTTKNLGGETADLVERMQAQLTGRLQIVNEEIKELVSRPELLNIDGHWVNPYHTQQINMQEDLHQLLREKTNLIARVKNIRSSLKLGKNKNAVIVDILQEFNEGSLGSYVATTDQFVQLKVTEQEMLNQFGDQHPDLVAIRKQIEMLDKLRKEELSSLQRGQSTDEAGEPREIVDIFLDLMDGKIEMLTMQEESIQEELLKAQAKSQAFAADVEQLKSLQRERDQMESGYAAIVERLSEIKAYETHLWRTMTELDPPSIGEQVAPNLPICLAGGLLMGCLAGFMFAGFKEMAEKTFRSSDDISTILGTRVVGHIHQFQRSRVRKHANHPNVAQEVVALHQPASLISEAYRAIRTTMFFKTRETGAKVIQITSPTPGDGKSTTISNLAASISQSGRRVLVIDADFRKPVQHKLFGLKNSIGVTSIIMGEVEPNEAIQAVDPEYLSVIACGPIPANPAELLTSHRFAAIIEHFRNEYDFILIDSPPILAVTDPTIICGHVDLVYLVMRIRNGCRTNSLQAKEVIDSIGVELGGIVVNGLRRRDQKAYNYSNSYGYSKYNYGKHASIGTANEAL